MAIPSAAKKENDPDKFTVETDKDAANSVRGAVSAAYEALKQEILSRKSNPPASGQKP
jgi:hypothetical protein